MRLYAAMLLNAILVFLALPLHADAGAVMAARGETALRWLDRQSDALVAEHQSLEKKLADASVPADERRALQEREAKVKALFAKINERMLQVGGTDDVARKEVIDEVHAGRKVSHALQRLRQRKAAGHRTDFLGDLAYKNREEWGLGDQFFVRTMLKYIRDGVYYQKFFWDLLGFDFSNERDGSYHKAPCRRINEWEASDIDCLKELAAVWLRLYRTKFVKEYDASVAKSKSLLGEYEQRNPQEGHSGSLAGHSGLSGISAGGADLVERWNELHGTFLKGEQKEHPLYTQWHEENERWLKDAHEAAADVLDGGHLRTLWWRYGTIRGCLLTLEVPDDAFNFPADGSHQSNDAINDRQRRSLCCGLLCRLVGIILDNPHGDAIYLGDRPEHRGIPNPMGEVMAQIIAQEVAEQSARNHIETDLFGEVAGHPAAAPARVLVAMGGLDVRELRSTGMAHAHQQYRMIPLDAVAVWDAYMAACGASNEARWLGSSADEARVKWQRCEEKFREWVGKHGLLQEVFIHERPAARANRYAALCQKMIPWATDDSFLKKSSVQAIAVGKVKYTDLLKEYLGEQWYKSRHSRAGRLFTRTATKQTEIESYLDEEGVTGRDESVRAAYALFLFLAWHKIHRDKTAFERSFPPAGEGEAGAAPTLEERAAQQASHREAHGKQLRPDVTTQDWREQVARISDRRGGGGSKALRQLRGAAREASDEVSDVMKRMSDEAKSLSAASADLREGNAKEALERVIVGLDAVESALTKVGTIFKHGSSMLDTMHSNARKALDDGYVRSKLGLEATEEIANIELQEVARKIGAAKGLATKFSRQLNGTIMRKLTKWGLQFALGGSELTTASPERLRDVDRRDLLLRTIRRIKGGEVTPEERRRILGDMADDFAAAGEQATV